MEQHLEPRDGSGTELHRWSASFPWQTGRFIDDADLTERRRVAVLGSKAANLLFPGRPMLGETITIDGTAFTVVGSVGKISRGNNDFDDQKVYIPVTTMQELFPLKGDNIPQDALTSIQYQPATKGEIAAAVAAVHRVIARAARLRSLAEGRV